MLELGHWAEAGIPLSRILRAATADNAAAFGMSDRGTIEVENALTFCFCGKIRSKRSPLMIQSRQFS
jgi:cytosine/adenosine deaminase-related metal-dependent hydrolase